MARLRPSNLVTLVDLAGTFVFAIEGAMTAIGGGLDLLGVLVLAFVTALGGGIIRDVLLGATPPDALRTWLYPTVALAGGAVAFAQTELMHDVPRWLMTNLDAVGLSLFAVAGTGKAMDRGLPSLVAVFLGTITATGGGTIRDILLTRVPAVLRIDIYASAALAGAAVMVVGRKAGLPPALSALIGGAACLALRLASVRFGWSLPRAVSYGG
ncbi:MAG TPA: TRIC cation channel family protein [Rhodopila sp.]|uniref:trimeric intracellular cation channel family protein n=1 Tax=Rhodopila sp. TaxID=2480087 RepID=UPI002BD0BC84|nr:TRIC cation channel family protein [Rhodopila sp.]HVY16760.1 TRIC cation channel family protein [Rhodopila sp.]